MWGRDIENLVIVKMEEYSPFSPSAGAAGVLLGNGDDLDEVKPIYSYISQNLDDAANEMLRLIPLNHLESITSTNSTPVQDTTNSVIGYIAIPQDYLRLHSLQMAGWKKVVHATVNIGEPHAEEQENEWTMGHPYKPVVVLDEDKLRYYSIEKGKAHSIALFKYIARFDRFAEYRSEVAELIALNCAKKIYETFGNSEAVSAMANEMNSLIGIMKI